MANIERRATIERGKDSGKPWQPFAACQRFDRPRRIPANVAGYCPPSVQPCAACQRVDRPRWIPANVAGFRPPSAPPLPVRPAIAATVRASPATFSRIRRQSIENGLASRPRPFATQSAASVRNRGEHRGKRPPVATIERGNRSTVRQSIRQAVAVRRAPPVSGSEVRAGFRRDRVPDSGKRPATVRRLSAVRPSAPDSSATYPAKIRRDLAQHIRQAVRAADFPRLYSIRKHETRKT